MQDSSYMLRAVLIVVPGVILFAAYAIARRGGDGSLSNGSAQTDAIAEAIRNSGDTEDQRASNGEDPTSCLLLAELHVYGAPEVGNRSGPVNTNGEPCWLEIVIYFPSEGGDCMPFVLPRRELSPAACTVLVADLPQIQAGFRGHLLGEFKMISEQVPPITTASAVVPRVSSRGLGATTIVTVTWTWTISASSNHACSAQPADSDQDAGSSIGTATATWTCSTLPTSRRRSRDYDV